MSSKKIRISNEFLELIRNTQDSIYKKTGKPISTAKATAILAKLTRQVIINTKPTINIIMKKKGRKRKSLDDFEI